MKACRIHHFGAPDVIVFEDIPRPVPGSGEVSTPSALCVQAAYQTT